MAKWTPHADFWKDRGLPEPMVEHKFHPARKWRFDFAWDLGLGQVAVEVEGGIWVRGAHTRGAHFMSDAGKYNEATRMGWEIYRFTPEQLQNDMEVHRYPKNYKGKRETVSEFLRSVLL